MCESLGGVRSAIQNVEGVQLRDPTANANNISIQQARAELQPQVVALKSAFTEMRDGLGCG